MGRTGIRGRGALYRYGPNHEIMAIVTRSKKYKNKIIYVDRKKLLEFIACKDLTSQMKIPGDKVIGDESKFSVVCRTFIELVFEESSVERGANFTEKDMTTFFASFASNKSISWNLNASNELLTSQFNDLGFFATMIYSGYIDDPRNTDNAWVEAEIWNFHYDKDEYFDKRIKNALSKWREVSSNVRIHSNDIIVDVLKEVAEKHNAFYN
jgi:ADP-ribose pyrophosphatase